MTGRLLVLAALSAAFIPIIGPNVAQAAPSVACVIQVNDDNYQTTPDAALTIDNPGVVANDQICGTDGLVISTSSPSHGTLDNFDDDGGGFTYTPDQGFTGTDTFTYVLEDVQNSPSATVTITVEQATTTTPSTTPASSTTSTTTSKGTTSSTTSTTVATAAAATTVTATPTLTG